MNGPHFSGPAFVRRGSESIVASEKVYEELLASRTDKCRYMLRHKKEDITITARGGPLGDRKLHHDQGYLASSCCRDLEDSDDLLRIVELS